MMRQTHHTKRPPFVCVSAHIPAHLESQLRFTCMRARSELGLDYGETFATVLTLGLESLQHSRQDAMEHGLELIRKSSHG